MSYQEQMLKLIDKYRDAGQKWPAESAEIATWAIHKKLYAPHPEDIIKQCHDIRKTVERFIDIIKKRDKHE